MKIHLTIPALFAALCGAHLLLAEPETAKPEPSAPFVFGETANIPTNELAIIQAELRQRLKTDQEVRTNPGKASEVETVDAENTAWLETVTRKWGWIDAKRFGTESARAAFLIVQHSGNMPLMIAALPEIEKDVKAKRLPDGQGYALLYDRVQLNLGKKQRYGSQFGQSEKGELTIFPLEDPAKVDLYRKEMGMQPLADYITILERMTGMKAQREDAPPKTSKPEKTPAK